MCGKSKDKKDIYMKNNDLIKSRYELTSSENRIYTFVSNELKKQTAKNEDVVKVTFDRDSLAGYIKNKKDSQPSRIKTVFSKFRKRSIFIQEINDNGEEIWSEYGFINGYSYNVQKDEFTVEMNTKIHDLITQNYKLGYTPINVDAIFNLNSVYSQRFYELLRCKSWKDGFVTYTVDELRSYLGLNNKKSYNKYSNFKNKVLDIAIDELNGSGLFNISYEEIKKGKSVFSLKFLVEDLEDRTYFKNKKSDSKVIGVGIEIQDDHLALCKEVENKFVPDPLVFTKGALRKFKMDFVGENFENEYMMELFEEAVALTMEKDNVEIISISSYRYFKGILKNKISDYYNSLIKQESFF